MQVNAKNTFSGATPLHCAAQENERGDKDGRLVSIKLLLAAGADATIAVIPPCALCKSAFDSKRHLYRKPHTSWTCTTRVLSSALAPFKRVHAHCMSTQTHIRKHPLKPP